jgi:DNA-binding NarL/FixJ family response regulator
MAEPRVPPVPAPPPLVGREREQAILREALASAMAGRGSLVLIGGEAGIGKTALAERLLAEATGQGALALVGRCYDLSETPPYGPWAEALSRAAGGEELPPPDLATGGGAASQASLFAQVRDYLGALAARRPVVLLLDDLHWADPASLDLLRVVGRQLADLPLLVLATYRSDELTRRHPLSPLLPLLVREARAERLDLRPLAEDGLRALAARYALSGADADRLVAYLRARSEGNPFFAGELLRALEEDGALRRGDGGWRLGELAHLAMPALLRQVLDGRLGRLTAEDQRLLAVASVIGQEVPLGPWATVGGASEDELLPTIEAAMGARLVAPLADGTGVRFAHALIREALYAGILPPLRRAHHRRTGEALAASPRPDPDAVAYHFEQARDARAVAWLVAAGDRADRLYAYLTAADRHERALALLGEDGDAALRGWLLVRLGLLHRHNDLPRSLAIVESAAPAVGAAGDAALAAYWRSVRGLLRCNAGRGREGLLDLRAGTAAVAALPDAARVAAALPACVRIFLETDGRSAYAGQLALIGNLVEARAQGEALLAAAGDAPPGDGTYGLALAYAGLGLPDQALATTERARAAYRRMGNHMMAIMASRVLVRFVLLPYRADRPVLRRAATEEQARDMARAAGGGVAAGEVTALMAQLLDSDIAVVEGSWVATQRAGLALLAGGHVNLFVRQVVASLGTIARAQGDLDTAWAMVRRMLPAGAAYTPGDQSFHIALPLQQLAPALALDAGDLPEARAWLEAYDRWLAWSGAVLGRAEGRALWAEYHRQAGDLGRARHHADAALAHASDPRQPLALLAAHRLVGELDTAVRRHADARRHLDTALALADACAAPYERALTLLALAESRAAAGERDGAARTLADARALLEPLGARPALARADAIGARLAPAAPSDAPMVPFGLTAREAEVLRLVAQGLSNLDIADRLSLSRRTVEQHLRNIYDKLGVDNRTAATAIAIDHGLR